MTVDFKELYERRGEIVERELSASGRLAVGTMCSYVPVEILHSFGIIPVRIWGQSKDIERADILLQQFICPPARHLMAMGLEGRYDFLDGIVHCYTCDATCGLFNIWVRNLEPGFSHLLSLPYMDIEESRDYAVAEYGALIAKLEPFTGRKYSEDDLALSIGLYAEARALAGEVYRLRALGGSMRYTDVYFLNACCQVFPVEMMIPLLKDHVSAMEAVEPAPSGRPRLLLSGSVITDVSLMSFIEDGGFDIVADDTCLGLRPLQGAPTPGEPLESLAEYYLAGPPCSSRADFPSRRRYLLETIAAYGIDAVLFVHQKFCDPHLSDHPFLKELLDEEGIPSMQLEVDGEGFTGQVRTRVEGFFEILETR